MKLIRLGMSALIGLACALSFSVAPTAAGGMAAYRQPTWWNKGQLLLTTTQLPPCGTSSGNFSEAPNVDMSNEATPQSETSIAINPSNPSQIVGGSNEIFCLPMRGYSSAQGGKSGSWHAVDLPLPPPLSTNGQDFGSDPGVAWDTLGNVYYSYIVVFFNRFFSAIQGTEMAVARSSDHGLTWTATYFNQNSGTGKFNDKPMITVDTNPASPHFNTVYVAWDNASFNQGKSSNNDVVLVSSSSDHGVTFSAPVAASPSGSGQAAVIGADPFVTPDGSLFVAWTDAINPAIRVSESTDGGRSFGPAHLIANTLATFQNLPPAQALRGALIYPACASDSSARLYCSWTDATASGAVGVFVSHSDDGVNWSPQERIDDAAVVNDQFNQWLAVDPSTQNVVLAWYDTRNDPTRVSTNYFFSESKDRGATFLANLQVATQPTNETCCGADLGNQYGDYEGIAALGGNAHPIWVDRRASIAAVPGLDEEVFTETIKE
ncbi:MAG TPA: sialidase family protein [Candidatus Dormibacteraeota bacterium]